MRPNNVYDTARSKHPNLQVKCRGTKKDVISDEDLQNNILHSNICKFVQQFLKKKPKKTDHSIAIYSNF